MYWPPNYLSKKILSDSLAKKYLEKGGRVIIVDRNPAINVYDSISGKVVALNFNGLSMFNIPVRHNDLRSYHGFYQAKPTSFGMKFYLDQHMVYPISIFPEDIDIPLSLDEFGRANSYIKRLSDNQNSGLVQV